MSAQWYYSHDGATHGPFSAEELKGHAARKLLLESDLLWPEGMERKDATPAAAALDFSQIAAAGCHVPDWLADIAAVESKGPAPGPLPSEDIPAWLDDLRLWVGLEVLTAPTTANAPSQPGEIPDWLQDWLTPEKPTVSPPPTMPTAVAAPPLSPPAISPAPTGTKPAPHKPANPVVEKVLETSGFDLETGQILDAARFQKWKQQQAQSTPVSNASLLEVFRKARLAVEGWVDDQANQACIMQTDIEAIKRRPSIQAILREFANFGKDMQEKLVRHLEFMVGNRRKYYIAVATRSNQ